MDLADLIDRRRTVREFAPRPVDEDDLRAVLWTAQGQTSDGRRTTPSAGGRYPLELLVIRGPHLAGTWTWDPDDRVLRQRASGDVRDDLAEAAIGDQPWVAAAPVVVVVCADMGGMVEHFADQPPGDRGRRYVDVEAGAAIQNLALEATARDLAGVIVGGFDDAAVAEVLDLDGLDPRLLFCLGWPS